MCCAVCSIVESEQSDVVIYRNPFLVLYHIPDVDLPGYLVLTTVRHVEDLGSLTGDEVSSMARIQQMAVTFLLQIPDIGKVYLSSFGEVCPHLHFHLFPRTKGMLENTALWTDGQVDGPLIFDHYRKSLRTGEISGSVRLMIQRLRMRFAEQTGNVS